MTLRQREPRIRDETHLRFVRTKPCCIAYCRREAEAAHLRMGNLAIGKLPTGGGERPSDCYVTPLCPYHHRIGIDCQHNSNEKIWWELRGINPWAIAASLWIESGGAARALEPKPAPRVQKTKARKSVEQRVKIHGRATWAPGRKLQSRGFAERHT